MSELDAPQRELNHIAAKSVAMAESWLRGSNPTEAVIYYAGQHIDELGTPQAAGDFTLASTTLALCTMCLAAARDAGGRKPSTFLLIATIDNLCALVRELAKNPKR